MYLWNRTPTKANAGVAPYERFYGTKPDVGHICTFGCVVWVTLPKEALGMTGVPIGWLSGLGPEEEGSVLTSVEIIDGN